MKDTKEAPMDLFLIPAFRSHQDMLRWWCNSEINTALETFKNTLSEKGIVVNAIEPAYVSDNGPINNFWNDDDLVEELFGNGCPYDGEPIYVLMVFDPSFDETLRQWDLRDYVNLLNELKDIITKRGYDVADVDITRFSDEDDGTGNVKLRGYWFVNERSNKESQDDGLYFVDPPTEWDNRELTVIALKKTIYKKEQLEFGSCLVKVILVEGDDE